MAAAEEAGAAPSNPEAGSSKGWARNRALRALRGQDVSALQLPALGLGTYRLKGEVGTQAISRAIDIGYRLVDTAQAYRNEAAIGEALKGRRRDDVWVVSKLPPGAQGEAEAYEAGKASAEKLGGKVDLFLVHWPGVKGLKNDDPEAAAAIRERRLGSWRGLVRLHDEGIVKAIGVSNYLGRHLDEIQEAGLPLPQVNQIEFHPLLQQRALRAKCESLGILVMGYAPLAQADARVMESEALDAAAAEAGCTPAQALLRWSLQRGVVPVPKSSRPERLEENLAALLSGPALSDGALAGIDGLEAGVHLCWDSNKVP